VPLPGLELEEPLLPEFPKLEPPKLELPKLELPNEELPKAEEPTGVEVLLAGWPMAPVFPPLMVCMSEMGS
jgi:hypothetical protein